MAGGGLHRHAHDALVASGLPHGLRRSCCTPKDNKLVKVEGDPLNAVANGKLCMRCLTMPEAVNHPDRLKYPLKRAGERGEDKWERISLGRGL